MHTEKGLTWLQEKGFGYSERTFDSLFSKKWQAEGEESSDGEPVTQEDSGFNLPERTAEPELEERPEPIREPSPEPAVFDINMLDPNKVNWFKYIIDTYLQDAEDGTQVLGSVDAYANLLSIVMSPKANEELEDELLNLVGFHNLDLLA
jgi:hypothetical protein